MADGSIRPGGPATWRNRPQGNIEWRFISQTLCFERKRGKKRSCGLVFTRIYKYVFFSLLPPFPYTPPNPSHPFLYILIAFILSFSFLQSFPLTPTLSLFLPFRTLFPLTSSLFLPFPFMTPFFSLLKEDNTLEPGHSFV